MIKKIISRLRLWTSLLGSNSPVAVMRYVLMDVLRRRTVLRMRVHGVWIYVRSATPDLVVARESLGRELDDAIALLPPETIGLIIDAGGYIGTAAMKLARAFPGAKVLTVEPAPDNLDVLRRNVAHIPNIEVVPYALAGRRGSGVQLWDTDQGAWGYSIIRRSGHEAGVAVANVQTVTIDGLMAQAGASHIRLLKLDIEGAEIDVLSNSAGWMHRTEILVAELHEWMVKGCEAAFEVATVGRVNRPLPGEKVISIG